ncbi:2-hydroxyacid dehydrogenase [Larsenimonas rhizosphaerae]|uniref:2-hydroxyacid dehydrogenase n=1 Tax=Larsenimonas rhizosphaerae TaxID=2944682 RepID=UPI002033BD7C|nr:2-hydroxyacid dehydrogenase [Larsenimonas rhizosphaerae]MCM2131404.1 2-hydroxyacid dehydrogenase [Larsenimonas rhizosphaerae]
MPIHMLVVTPLSRHHRQQLADADIILHLARTNEDRETLIATQSEHITAVLTIGTIGFTAEEMDRLPHLTLICAQGVGFENIDVEAARARHIAVTHGPGTNAGTVADHTFGLMLASLRRIVQSDRAVREGRWDEVRRSLPALHDKTLGILGMGNVGQAIAHRAWHGFDMPVRYYSRHARTDLPYTHDSDPLALAQGVDILVAALPGGSATRHMVNREMMDALGPKGLLINIGRGSVVDTAALIDALHHNTLGQAALDVLEDEPEVPAELSALTEQVILTPHTAGLSPSAIDATIALVIENVSAIRRGDAPVTPVPLV